MAEGDPFWGRHVVAAVVQARRRSDASIVKFEHAIRDEARVEPVAERIDADRGDDEPQYAGLLAARQREYAEGSCAEPADGNPENDAKQLHVRNGLLRKRGAMQAQSSPIMSALSVAFNAVSADAEALRKDGHTVMFVATEGRPAGLSGAADPIKASSAEALKTLHDDGVRIVVLTGDNRTTAEAVAKSLASIRSRPR